MLVVLTTTSDMNEADKLAAHIVGNKLAACVQILPSMTSIYFWEGKIEKENEHLLLIKTLPEKYEELDKFIRANHSYDVPEIVAIEAVKVSDGYAKWLGEYLTVT